MGKKKDRWPDLCKSVEKSDGLPTRGAGTWTEDKLWFWNRYVDITTSAMVDNPKWPEGLVYVDLFAGPGVCEIQESGKRFPGSPLIAANAPKPFRKILLSELDRNLADALSQRMSRTHAARQSIVFQGDCNDKVREIASAIPEGSLTLAFIDPEGLHQKFETIRTLADRGRVDLLILFADSMDIVRNVERYHLRARSNLDEVLGPKSGWRARWENLVNRTRENICSMFADEYQNQLREHLGYKGSAIAQ